MPMGRNGDGEWVNLNNACNKCGHSMPLPEMNRKYCPQCGTYCHVPSEQELAEAKERAKKVCPKCNFENVQLSLFCIRCGAKL